MLISLVTCFVLTLTAAADDSAATLFEQAETLAKGNRKQEALAKVEAAVAELERASGWRKNPTDRTGRVAVCGPPGA